jgi:hypothetical protein
MMRFFLLLVSLLVAETSVSGSIQDLSLDYVEESFPDYISEDDISTEFAGDFSGEYWTPGELGHGFQHADKADFTPFMIADSNFYDRIVDPVTFLETSGDEANDIALLASGCHSTGKLGARDGELQCPPPQAARTRKQKIPVPKLPLFGEFMDIVAPPAFTQEDHGCPPLKPYYLCCDCNGWTDFGLCTDCTPCKLASYLLSLSWSRVSTVPRCLQKANMWVQDSISQGTC